MFVSALTYCSSTKGQYIIYDLPESVTSKVEKYLDKYKSAGDTSKFVAQLSKSADGKYTLFIINHDFSGLENFKLIEEYLIKRTSRKIRINETLLPLITDEDFIFADFGSEKMKNGRMAKKKVVFTSESYAIKFDKSGKIYNE